MSSSGERGCLRHARVATRLGPLRLAASEAGLCWLGLRPEGDLELLRSWARRFAPGLELREAPSSLVAAGRQLVEYASGRRRAFDLELDLRGSEFQRAVWTALLEIPFGATRTYGELARRLGRPGASRAVGGAAGANPVPLVVPCHRLLAEDGLGGFSGGLERKRRLLALEGRVDTPDLFERVEP